MDINDKIIKDKHSYKDVLGELYNRNKETSNMIKSILAPLRQKMIDDPDTVMILIPMATDLIETNVKNDTQLHKLTDSIQKLILSMKEDADAGEFEILNFLDSIGEDDSSKKQLEEYKQKTEDIFDSLQQKESIVIEDDDAE